MKNCPRCGAMKPPDQFVRNRSARDGVGSYCHPCHNELGRQNRVKNWGGSRYYHLKARYGISRDSFERLWERQGGLCAICLREPAARVDHDHSTGSVRGLLCFRCDGGLGLFRDDTLTLAMAITSLDRIDANGRIEAVQEKAGQ